MKQSSNPPKTRVFIAGVISAVVLAVCLVAAAIILAVTARGWYGPGLWYGGGVFGREALGIVYVLGTTSAAVLFACVVAGIVRFVAARVRQGRYGYYSRIASMMPGGPFKGDSVLIGTVRSADVGSAVFSVTDADGEAKSVHVNPLTRITKQSLHGTLGKRKDETRDNAHINTGDFVVVKSFNTGTKTLEAAFIQIFSEE